MTVLYKHILSQFIHWYSIRVYSRFRHVTDLHSIVMKDACTLLQIPNGEQGMYQMNEKAQDLLFCIV